MPRFEACLAAIAALVAAAPAGAQEAPPAEGTPAASTPAATTQPSGQGPAAAPADVATNGARPSAAPAIAPAAPAVVAIVPAPPPTDAVVHVAIDYEGAWLEGRSRVDLGAWQRLCPTPCDRSVRVEGLELRVAAPNMTTSNTFAIDPGAGTARLRVAGGSKNARNLGIIGLAGGLSVTFAGMALFGLGSLEDRQGERTAGIVGLALGGAAIAVALPLLFSGSTTVRDGHGRTVAKRPFLPLTF